MLDLNLEELITQTQDEPHRSSEYISNIVHTIIIEEQLKQDILHNIERARSLATTSASSTHDLKKQVTGKQALINATVLLKIVIHCQNSADSPIADKVMKGGHVVLEDNGKLLNFISKLHLKLESNCQPQVHHRYSSHYHFHKAKEIKRQYPELSEAEITQSVKTNQSDYSFRAEIIFNECLFGQYMNEAGQLCSWLQFEGHSHQPRTFYDSHIANSVDSFLQISAYSLEKLGHHLDWLRYVFLHNRRVNIGQYGHSSHTENNQPLVISPSGLKENTP